MLCAPRAIHTTSQWTTWSALKSIMNWVGKLSRLKRLRLAKIHLACVHLTKVTTEKTCFACRHVHTRFIHSSYVLFFLLVYMCESVSSVVSDIFGIPFQTGVKGGRGGRNRYPYGRGAPRAMCPLSLSLLSTTSISHGCPFPFIFATCPLSFAAKGIHHIMISTVDRVTCNRKCLSTLSLSVLEQNSSLDVIIYTPHTTRYMHPYAPHYPQHQGGFFSPHYHPQPGRTTWKPKNNVV